MEKKIIRTCYGRTYQLIEVPRDPKSLCPGCVFNNAERFCMKPLPTLTKSEARMRGMCADYPSTPKNSLAWTDVTPAWKQFLNRIIGRK